MHQSHFGDLFTPAPASLQVPAYDFPATCLFCSTWALITVPFWIPAADAVCSAVAGAATHHLLWVWRAPAVTTNLVLPAHLRFLDLTRSGLQNTGRTGSVPAAAILEPAVFLEHSAAWRFTRCTVRTTADAAFL